MNTKKITAVAAEIRPSTIPDAPALIIVAISVFEPIEIVMKNVTIIEPAIPFPAISNAVPWSTVLLINGSPNVSVTDFSKSSVLLQIKNTFRAGRSKLLQIKNTFRPGRSKLLQIKNTFLLSQLKQLHSPYLLQLF